MNQAKENSPYKDIRVRQAFQLLMDGKAQTIASYSSDRWGRYDGGFSEAPYEIPTAERDALLGFNLTWDQRVAKAQQLMKDAGYPDGFNYVVPCNNMAGVVLAMQAQTSIWDQNLKTKAKLEPMDQTNMYKARDAGNYDMYSQETLNSSGDPGGIVGFFTTGSTTNYAKYSNATFDKLAAQIMAEPNLTARVAAYQQFEKQILTDLPVLITGVYQRATYTISDKVMNYNPGPSAYTSGLTQEYVWFK